MIMFIWKLIKFILWEKYILAPQTTIHSPDGPPNYQYLDSGPPNYNFLIFWPHPSIYAVNSNRNWLKTRKYSSLNVRILKCMRGIFEILFRINKFCIDNNCQFALTGSHFFVKDNQTGQVLFQGPSENGLQPV